MDENLKKLIVQILLNIKSFRKLIVLLIVIGGLCGYTLSHLVSPKYVSTQVLSMQDQEAFNTLLKNVVAPLNNAKSTKSVKSVILSLPILEKIAINSNIINPEDSLDNNYSLLSSMARKIDLNKGATDNQTIRISYTGNNPQQVKTVVQEISNQFIEETQKFRIKTAKLASVFLKQKLIEIQKRIDSLEINDAKFRKKHFYSLPEFLLDGGKGITQIKIELAESKTYLQETIKRISLLKESIKKYNPQRKKIENALNNINKSISQLESELTNLHPKMASLIAKRKQYLTLLNSKEFGENIDLDNSAYLDLNNMSIKTNSNEDVFTFTRKLQLNELLLEQERLEAKISEYNKIIKSIKGSIEDIPKIEGVISKNNRLRKFLNKNWGDLNQKYNDAVQSIEMANLNTHKDFTILVPASLPGNPVYPIPLNFILMGAFIFVIILILIIVINEWLLGRITDETDVKDILEIDYIGTMVSLKKEE